MIKIKTKMPNFDSQRHNELIASNWKMLKEPGNIYSAIVLSFPLMILNVAITLGLLSIIEPLSLNFLDFSMEGFSISIDLKHIVGLIALLILHEALHFICIPDFRTSKNTSFGITPIGGFVYSEENIKKSRYISITVAPFLIISFVLPILLGLFKLLTPYPIFLILLNSAASSVDILNLINIVRKVPENALITSNGAKTYWLSK